MTAGAPSRADPPRPPLGGYGGHSPERARCHGTRRGQSPGPVPELARGAVVASQRSAQLLRPPTARSCALPSGPCARFGRRRDGSGSTRRTGPRSPLRGASWPCPGRVWRRTGPGRPSGCRPGRPSAASTRTIRDGVNFVRGLAGLSPVTFSKSLAAKAQKAALIMSANQTLTHAVPRSFKCYTKDGALAASKSNLYLAWPEMKAESVVPRYMARPGARRRDIQRSGTAAGSSRPDSKCSASGLPPGRPHQRPVGGRARLWTTA